MNIGNYLVIYGDILVVVADLLFRAAMKFESVIFRETIPNGRQRRRRKLFIRADKM